MYYALIMAGGTGSRLWPLSRQAHPKQTLRLIGDRSMFQHAVERLAPLFPTERVKVVTRAAHVAPLSQQVPDLPQANYIIEPQGRGTAPAIGLAALHLVHTDPEAVMAVLTADHYITDTGHFRDVLAAAGELAQAGYLVTLGIKPNSPSTGFGYIKQGEPLEQVNGFAGFRVAGFTEKPDLATAQAMIAGGEYAWNSGMFIWRADRILEEFERQMPEFYSQLQVLDACFGTADYEDALARIWPTVEKETIDYGIMENAENVAVLPVDIGWTDIGSWGSLPGLLPADEQGNTVVANHLNVDTRDTLVFSDSQRLIATIGLEGLVIVETADAILVCAKGREQDVRAIVKRLESEEASSKWL